MASSIEVVSEEGRCLWCTNLAPIHRGFFPWANMKKMHELGFVVGPMNMIPGNNKRKVERHSG